MASLTLEDTVINGGYCIGCGICAISPDDNYHMGWSPDGLWRASRRSIQQSEEKYLRVCPFSSRSANEDEIGRDCFAATCNWDSRIGYYASLYTGYVKDTEYRRAGSSGGLTSWTLEQILGQGLVDGVIHVRPAGPDPLFEYRISHHVQELRLGRKSHYYPVELSRMMRQALKDGGRYAVVGVPCFIKAVRLWQREHPAQRDRFPVLVALVCGHLKSKFYAQMLAWQLGVAPSDLASVDFRVKLPGKSAMAYGFRATSESGAQETRQSSHLFGGNWGHGLFKYKACDYCDDVMGETGDISFGDAWLPEYTQDEHGTNIVIVRNDTLNSLLIAARDEGAIHLEPVVAHKIYRTQAWNYRQRREGLAYRLYLAEKLGQWAPPKRISPSATIGTKRFRQIIEIRMRLRERSFTLFRRGLLSGRWDDFVRDMRETIQEYDRIYNPLSKRLLKEVWKVVSPVMIKVPFLSRYAMRS